MATTDSDAAPPQQLTFEIVNKAGGVTTPDVVFITDDASYNQLALQIGLTSGSTTLTPGTIPDPGAPPPASGTTMYIDLSALQLSSAVWERMTLDGAGWRFQKFASQGVVGMTPTRELTVSSGTSGQLAIAIAGVVISQPLATPQVQLFASYDNVPGVTGQYASFAVAVQNRPDDRSKDLSDAIAVSVDQAGMINSIPPLLQAANRFSLLLASTHKVQVPAGPDTVFTVAFVYGAQNDPYGFGALTDITNANLIRVTAGSNAEQWVITHNESGQSPSWTLQPPAGAPIVGSGAQSIVAIEFASVVTTYQPGPTAMLISYAGVPGYKDGTYALVLDKIAHAQITALDVSPNPTYFSGGSAEVKVSWTVAGAQSLELSQNAASTPVTGKTEVPATLTTELTTFGLKVTGGAGSVENVDYRTVNAVALPVINSFTGTPTEIYAGSTSHDARFAWAVDSSDGVTLTSTGGAFSGESYGAIDRATASILEPQMITLAPQTAGNPLTLTRRLVLSAFRPAAKRYALGFTPASVAASPTGPFVLLAGPDGSLTVVDTVQYAQAGSVALGHPATSVRFSPDGTTVATTNSDGTLSIVGVTLGAGGMPVFGAPSAIELTATPQQLIFSPNGPRIFATIDPGGGARGQVVSLLGSGGRYELEGTAYVGVEPRGLTLDAAGMRIFVANAGDDTASIIGLTAKGGLGSMTTIHALTGGPTGIAATPSGQQLVISAATSGTVIVVDPNHPDTGQRQTLTVGPSPGAIALTPSGAYAFVANGDGTVSLINTWGLPSTASVLGGPLEVGSALSDLAIPPDGQQVMVANAGGLGVVTLATYAAIASQPSTPNHPTSAAMTPDLLSVFAWHDATIPAISPSPGILVYATGSGEISNLLASTPITQLVVAPDPKARQALAISADSASLHVIATDRLTATEQSLGLPAGTAPVALAISGDGATAFVATSDAKRNLQLAVLAQQQDVWTTVQTLALYQATTAGRMLLRATPDGTSVFLVDIDAAQVRAIQQVGGRYVLARTVITGDVSALDLTILPDGSTAYVLNAGTTTNTITVIDVATLQSHVAAVPQTYVNLTALQSSPDGRRLFAPDSNAAALRVLDPSSLRIQQTIPLSANLGTVRAPNGLVVAPDGSSIFTANTDSQNLAIVQQIQMGTLGAARPAPIVPRRGLVEDPYSGLFMRHYLGETPGAPADGWSGSPDVIPFGQSPQPDLSQFTSQQGYATDFGANVYLQNQNYVYIRGLNTTSAPITSRAYFYYTASDLAMWPANWQSQFVTHNGAEQNWVAIQAPASGVGVGQIPLIWTPPALPPNNSHYCVIAWVDNSANPQPPDFAKYSKFETWDDMVQFVVSHHNMAWRNTTDYPTPPPDFRYATALTMQAGGGSVLLSVDFVNVPFDGTFSVGVQGTDPANTVALPPSSLSNYQGGFHTRTLNYPPNFATSVQVTHWPGPTPLPPSAQINVTVAVQTRPSLMRDIERLYRPRGLRSPIRIRNGIPIVIAGTQSYNLRFGAAASKKASKR